MIQERAHPRSRGENASPSSSRNKARGSSPLTRGKCAPAVWAVRLAGLIPAHAGKIPSTPRCCPGSGAHPRSRGENLQILVTALLHLGSSPLTRGKFRAEANNDTNAGLIPAHAGKIPAPKTGVTKSWAHPRSRGENRFRLRGGGDLWGSSPLTRGKSRCAASSRTRRGLIPAHAGKIRSRRSLSRTPGAHPRSRGENAGSGGLGSHDLGSSPLTRGKWRALSMFDLVARLIPAHAGKMSSGKSPFRA